MLRSSLEDALSFEGSVVGEIALGPTKMPVPRLGVAPPLVSSSGAVGAMAMYAGESVRFVRAVEPAAEIVRSIADGAERLLRAWC